MQNQVFTGRSIILRSINLCCQAMLVSLLLGSIAWAQNSDSDDAFAKVLKNEAIGISQSSIDEILDIRRRLGGGTNLTPTKLDTNAGSDDKKASNENGAGHSDDGGTVSNSSDVERIDEGSIDRRKEYDISAASSLDYQAPSVDEARTQSERMFYQLLQKAKPIHVGRSLVRSNLKGQRVSNIRETARCVDQLAADLEELELFGDADQLRVMASRIRNKARQDSRTAQRTREMR